jgi:hypothetical protein
MLFPKRDFVVLCATLLVPAGLWARTPQAPKTATIVIIDNSGRYLDSLFSGLQPSPGTRPEMVTRDVRAPRACPTRGKQLSDLNDVRSAVECPECSECAGECSCAEPVGCGGCNGCCFEVYNFRNDCDQCDAEHGTKDCYPSCHGTCCLDVATCINN